jgi:hypothetical protein
MRTWLRIAAFAVLFLFMEPWSVKAATCGPTAVCSTGVHTFSSADGTTPATLYTATGNGAHILSLFCTVPGLYANPPDILAYVNKSGTAYKLFDTGFSGTSGWSTSATQNVMLYTPYNPINQPFTSLPSDEYGNQYIQIGSGDLFQVGMGATITGANTITCIADIVQY